MLQGKLSLITGSTSGIGLGIARALAAQGSDIVLNGFGEPGAIEALRAGMASEFGVRVSFEAADLMQPAQTESLMARCAAHGGIDILVNNAGIQHTARVEAFPPERWDAVIALNLSSAFHTTRLALPGMQARRWGRIVNIASAHGLVASAEKSAYVAAKHGLIGLTKVVALENARSGITCNAICPGWVLTPLVQKQIDARVTERGIDAQAAKDTLLGEKQPSMEFVTPEQLGAMAVFLCSPAGDQVRGAAWSMDGGWTAQ
jgi:3-hydroxybutyrate dehydrogenase